MEDLLGTFSDWYGAVSGLTGEGLDNGFYEFVTAILRSMGFAGEWVGFSSNADVTDWLVSLFGPLATIYEFFISSIDSATFITIVNYLLSIFAK